jgi:hypothetical protein
MIVQHSTFVVYMIDGEDIRDSPIARILIAVLPLLLCELGSLDVQVYQAVLGILRDLFSDSKVFDELTHLDKSCARATFASERTRDPLSL